MVFRFSDLKILDVVYRGPGFSRQFVTSAATGADAASYGSGLTFEGAGSLAD